MKKKKPPTPTQAPLFDGLEVVEAERDVVEKPKRPTIQARFEDFHRANPHVLARLRAYAYEAKRAGRKRIGMKMLWERLRWWAHVEVASAEDFKLSNDFTSRYARYLMEGNPDLAELFETRKLRRR